MEPTTVPTMAPPDPNLNQPLEAVIVQPKKAIWNTRNIAHYQKNIELYVKLHLIEVIVYGLFLIIFTNTFSDVFEYRTNLIDNEISALFLDSSFYGHEKDEATIKFENIISYDHFWNYLTGVVCEKLYNVPIAQELDDKVLYENKFLYRPRVRQVRIGDEKCGIRKHFTSLFKKCYASYSIKDEDTSSFGLKNGTAWTYSDESAQQGVPYSTVIGSYGAGGYYFDFPETKVNAIDLLENLKSKNWITHNTRAVFIDFAIFNYNLETISIINLVFEFPASGGIVPGSSFQTIELYDYVWTNSKIVMIGMVITLLFLIYYTLEEIFEIHYYGMRYFSIFWNWIDLFIVLLGWEFVAISINILLAEPTPKLEEKYRHSKGTAYYNMIVSRHIHITDVMGMLFFLISVKLFKYSDVCKPMTIIYMSLGRCFKTILKNMAITSIIMVTYITFGFCIYGSQVTIFSTVKNSFLSATKILMRDFDFFLVKSDSNAIFFILYCCFTVFGLSGLLMAMVFHTYFDVDVETLLDGRKLYMFDIIAIHIDNILDKMSFNKYADRRREERLQRELDGYYSYQEVYKTLKRSNFSDSETKSILDKHGIEPQTKVHEDEAKYMFSDILDNLHSEQNESKSDVYWLTDRVEILENSVKEANTKLDVVMKNLNSVKITEPPTSE